MSLSEERAGRNEALFREVNENIEAVSEQYRDESTAASFVCECADAGCVDQVQVAFSLYERVRANPRWFLLVEGHESAAVEHVVAHGPGYVVVEKENTAGRIAERTDPRQ